MKKLPAILLTLLSLSLPAAEFAGFQLDELGNLSAGTLRFIPQIFEPGWTSTAPDARAYVLDSGFPKVNPESGDYSGTLKLRKSGKAVNFKTTLAKTGERSLNAVWLVDNVDGAEIIETYLHLVQPVAAIAGKKLRFDGREGAVPETFTVKNPIPDRASCARLEIPLASGKLVVVGKFSAAFQDDRVFKSETFTVRIRFDARTEGLSLAFALADEGDAVADLKAPPVIPAKARALQRPWAQTNALALERVTAPKSVAAGSCWEADLAVRGTFQNPFDPDEIRVRAHFTSPSGKTFDQAAFFFRPYTRSGGQETPSGEPRFRLRFTPGEAGLWQVALTLKDKNATLSPAAKSFQCQQAANPGFIRPSKRNPNYFAFDDGSTYFAVGENVCWGRSLADYDEWFGKLAAAGGNYARIWIGPFDLFTLERIPSGSRDPAGLGAYDLLGAWRVDEMLSLAASKGIRILFCIDSFNSFSSKSAHSAWDRCPYNQAQGGPCADGSTFFSNAIPKALFKKRLDYIAARWSHDPTILGWEFFNEVEQVDGFTPELYKAWHLEMARYLRGIDPFQHPQTSGWGYPAGEPLSDALPEMDFLQSHHYTTVDAAEYIAQYSLAKSARFAKPHFFGEFGLDVKGIVDLRDGSGINLHNGLWAGIFTLGAGTGMMWWWDNLVNPSNLYGHFAPPARFVSNIPFAAKRYAPLDLRLSAADGRGFYNPVKVAGVQSVWKDDPANRAQTITVARDGRVSGHENLSRNLHGKRNHPSWHNPVTFEVDCARADQVRVFVAGVSTYGGANLKIRVDGDMRLEKDFSRHAMVQSGGTHEYDGAYGVPLAAGRHTITIANEGADWLEASYEPCSVETSAPALYAWALADAAGPGPALLLWVKDPNASVENLLLRGGKTEPWKGLVVTAPLPDGAWRAQWWNTWEGKVVSETPVKVSGGKLRLEIPAFDRDVALKVMP